MIRGSRWRWNGWVVGPLLCLLAWPVRAVPEPADERIPIPMQAVIIKKILPFSRTLAQQELRILVVHTEADEQIRDEVLDAFGIAGVETDSISLDDLEPLIDAAKVVYFTSEIDTAQRLCEQRGILTIANDPKLVEAGEVAVGFALEQNRPKIVVHMGALSAVNHRFSASLLRMARIIR